MVAIEARLETPFDSLKLLHGKPTMPSAAKWNLAGAQLRLQPAEGLPADAPPGSANEKSLVQPGDGKRYSLLDIATMAIGRYDIMNDLVEGAPPVKRKITLDMAPGDLSLETPH